MSAERPGPTRTPHGDAWRDLRLPVFRQVAIAFVVTVPVMWWLTRPRSGRSTSPGALAIEELTTYATVLAGVVALVLAVGHLVRPTPGLAAMYSALALLVLLGNAGLLVMGYWYQMTRTSGEPYSFAPALVLISLAALVPAVLATLRT